MNSLAAVLSIIFLMNTAGTGRNPNPDPYYKSFFQKTRLIMTKEEIHIYKHLPDNKSREEYIKEFWKQRDPTPDTEENEVKEEFEERIAYANRWFREGNGKDRGWDTQRGRILVQLGFPDERHWGVLPSVDRFGYLRTTKRTPMEMWLYFRFKLCLIFRGDFEGAAVLKLIPVVGELLKLQEALEKSKFRLDIGMQGPRKNEFRFKVKYKKNRFVIKIPVKRISFEKKNGQMDSEFRVAISVFKDYKKIEKITDNITLSRKGDELLKSKKIEFALPYSPPQKGKYFFDIVIQDAGSSSKYRNCFTHRF